MNGSKASRNVDVRWLFAGVAVVVAAACGSSGETDAGFAPVGSAGMSGRGGGASGTGGTSSAGTDSGGTAGTSAGAGGSAGTAGTGGTGGTGGSAGMANTGDIKLGMPITAPDGQWTSVPFPDAYCRDGTAAHIMVHLNSASKKTVIYEEGGGACFNDASCTFLSVDLPSYVLGGGIFNFNRPDNPVKDWNIFYIPYCTSDVHSGDNAAADVGTVTGKQHFSGYTNLKTYLSRILPTVPDTTDLLLTGSSAGGFGVGLTADLVARNMPKTVQRFTMLDDSGPPMSNKYLLTCLQDRWQSVWGFQNTFLKDCGAACPNPANFIDDWLKFLISKYAKGPNAPTFMAGLVSATGDSVISTFFGFGANGCMTAVPVAIPAPQFEAGLLEIRASLSGQTDRFGTFFYGSTQHTTLIGDAGTGLLGGLYDTQAGGVKLTDWISDLLTHKKAAHVGPLEKQVLRLLRR